MKSWYNYMDLIKEIEKLLDKDLLNNEAKNILLDIKKELDNYDYKKNSYNKNKNELEIKILEERLSSKEKHYNKLKELIQQLEKGDYENTKEIINNLVKYFIDLDDDIVRLGFRIDLEHLKNMKKNIEEELKNMEQNNFKSLTGFFFVFTLIASNIGIIFKASESMNVFYFISLILIINGVLLNIMMYIFDFIYNNKTNNFKLQLNTASIGVLLGIGILIFGASFKGEDRIIAPLVERGIEIKTKEQDKKITELTKMTESQTKEIEEMKQKITEQNQK